MCDLKTSKSESYLDTLELTVGVSDKIELNTTELLYSKRQRSKAINTSVNGKLLYLNSPLHKAYQKAYYCNSHLFQDGNKVTAAFCKKRSCIICSRVYSAKLMAGYMKPLLELEDLHLVTVGDVNVKKDKLNQEVDIFMSDHRLIYQSMKRQGFNLQGFFKLEQTYNSRRNDFNPHIHLLINGKDAAEEYRRGWIKRHPNCNPAAQHIRKVKDKGGLIEVFKYVTKAIISDTFDSRSLDVMYQSIHGRQVYRAFGIKKVKDIELEDFETRTIEHRGERIEVWKWCQDKKDWYSPAGEKFNNSTIEKDADRIIGIVEKSKNHVLKKQRIYDGPTDAEIFKRFRADKQILF